MPGGNEFADTFAEHKFLTAILIYFVVGVVYWIAHGIHLGPTGKAPEVPPKYRQYLDMFFLPVMLPAGFIGAVGTLITGGSVM